MVVSVSLLLVISSEIQLYLTVTFINSLIPYPTTSLLHGSHQDTEESHDLNAEMQRKNDIRGEIFGNASDKSKIH